MRISHKADKALNLPERWEDRWEGPDGGLLASYARGLDKGADDPSLQARALAGELPVLPWAGGLETAIKTKTKMGTFLYLAMWQGIRGDDLDIDTSMKTKLTCARFGVTVTFTGDVAQLTAIPSEET